MPAPKLDPIPNCCWGCAVIMELFEFPKKLCVDAGVKLKPGVLAGGLAFAPPNIDGVLAAPNRGLLAGVPPNGVLCGAPNGLGAGAPPAPGVAVFCCPKSPPLVDG